MEYQDNFYDKDGIVVRRSKDEDIEYLKNNLRQCDIDELWASSHSTPEDGLRNAFDQSAFALTIVKEKPIGIFGLTPLVMIGMRASVWFLATEELDSIGRRFAKHSRYFIDVMLRFYPYLFNYVDERNVKSIKWLKICGAEFQDPQPYGAEGLPFRYFYFIRGDYHV